MDSGAVCMDSGTDEGDEVHVDEEEEVGCMTGRWMVNWLDGMGNKWRERVAFIMWDTPQWEVHHKGPTRHRRPVAAPSVGVNYKLNLKARLP
jgi:hypothetical protein